MARTHGGLKNCSSTTYIPRAISVNRKYFPALSSDDSLLSSHLSGFGNRKPGGGGPEGVAFARRLVENAARGLVVGENDRKGPESRVVGRLRATSIVKGFADAMMWWLVAIVDCRGVVST
jgi:hypothetical protein